MIGHFLKDKENGAKHATTDKTILDIYTISQPVVAAHNNFLLTFSPHF
jgi:hypothetical protein